MSKENKKSENGEKKEQDKGKKKPTWKMFLRSLKITKKYIRPYRRILIWSVVFSVIGAVMQAFVPYLSGRIIDEIIGIAQGSEVAFLIFGLLGLWFLVRIGHDLIDWRVGFKNNWISERTHLDYISDNLGKLFEKPVEFHKDKKRGEVWEKIMRASRGIDELIRNISIRITPAVLTFIAALIITFSINSTLAGVLIVAIVLYIFVLWRSVPQLAGLQRDVNKRYSAAYGSAHDALGNIQEVKQNATETYEQDRIRTGFVERAMPVFMNMIQIYRRIDVVQRVLIIFSQLAIFIISIYFVQKGAITPGELVAFNGYAAMMFGPFVILGQSWQRIQNGIIEISEAQKILDEPAEIYKPEGGVSLEKLGGRVEFRNVSFSYNQGGSVLKNISFEVKPGERIALVGESGVGKSTLISLILGVNLPTEGKILIDGRSLEKLNLTAYRSRIGVVNQEPTLFNDTVGYNIEYGSFGVSDYKLRKAAKQAHAHEFIMNLPDKYEQRVGWKGIKLSIGQKQRITLARAFLKNPDILILDEPTSALDARSEYLIKESLKQLMEGRTTFVIAHRFSTVREADRILVFKGGKIVESGTHKELVKKKDGVYHNLYDLQVGMY